MKEKIAYRSVKVLDRAVQTVTDIIFILLLLIALYFLADTIYVYSNARADEVGAYKPWEVSDMEQVKVDCKDLVAWITLDDTKVNYPIVQGKDNTEYLNKNALGEYSLSGAIFLDKRNSPDFSDDYSVIYGHHMTRGYMFGALDYFEEPEYFEAHKTGTLITLKEKFHVTVCAFMYTDARDDMVFDPEADQSGLPEYVSGKAINYRGFDEGKRIVALTTCKSPTSTRRMIVFLTIDEAVGEGEHEAIRNDGTIVDTDNPEAEVGEGTDSGLGDMEEPEGLVPEG